jgi:hypothetical protein
VRRQLHASRADTHIRRSYGKVFCIPFMSQMTFEIHDSNDTGYRRALRCFRIGMHFLDCYDNERLAREAFFCSSRGQREDSRCGEMQWEG